MHNQKVGQFGEELACKFLIKHGYSIKDRNFKASYKELDIVAENDEWLVFVEVKTRMSWQYGDGTESLSQKKQRDLKYAINRYIDIKKLEDREPRGDLILIHLDKYTNKAKIEHFENIL